MNDFDDLENSSKEELIERIEGLGKSTALYFQLNSVIANRIRLEKHNSDKFVANSLTKVGNFLFDYYKNSKCEEFTVMLLDNSYGLIEFTPISIGSVNSANVDVRKVVRYALLKDASHVILAHNHPSGTTNQSSEDRVVTVQVEAALQAVGISLMEHIIVSDVGYAPTLHTRLSSSNPLKLAKMYREFYNN